MLIFLQVRQAKKTYSSPDGYLRYRQSLGNSQEVTDLPKRAQGSTKLLEENILINSEKENEVQRAASAQQGQNMHSPRDAWLQTRA